MKTFDELVKEGDRASIKELIQYSMDTQIQIKNDVIEPIDLLILFAKQIKKEYKYNTKCRGICLAKLNAILYMNNINEFGKKIEKSLSNNVFLYSRILDSMFNKRFAYTYVQRRIEWMPDFKESCYWWTLRYGKQNNPKMARCIKPRLMFLDWIINVLTAYKNEYLMSNINQNDKSKTNS